MSSKIERGMNVFENDILAYNYGNVLESLQELHNKRIYLSMLS